MHTENMRQRLSPTTLLRHVMKGIYYSTSFSSMDITETFNNCALARNSKQCIYFGMAQMHCTQISEAVKAIFSYLEPKKQQSKRHWRNNSLRQRFIPGLTERLRDKRHMSQETQAACSCAVRDLLQVIFISRQAAKNDSQQAGGLLRGIVAGMKSFEA